LADEISKRKASKLEPLSTDHLPLEIQPLVAAQNQLFVQVAEAFDKERRFTADASHELRTPLAGLLAQAQVAMKTDDAQVRQQALHQIEVAVNRMTHLVQQLLTLARIDPSTDFIETQPTNLNAEIHDVITTLEHYAHAKQISLELQAQDSAIIDANPQLINILIRNIIDNAIQYTPNQGRILISVSKQQNIIVFTTEDSGHGIAEHLYEQVLSRFYRCVENANTTRGSGLGLSIVKQIAKSHGAQLALSRSTMDGLKVTITFPGKSL
jgi:two-component system sensor histidine kinase QseC